MDHKTRFTKTAKGLAEALGKTKALSKDYRRVIKEVDGHASFNDLQAILGNFSDNKLSEILQKLVADEYIRGFNLPEAATVDESEIPAEAEIENALSILTMGAFLREVEHADKAQSEELLTNSEAEQAANKLASQEQARLTVEALTRQNIAEKIRSDTDAKAKKLVEEKARQKVEAQAKKELEELAKTEAATKAKKLAEEKARQKEQAQAKKEADELAKRQAAEQLARQKAEAQARKEIEENTKREAAAKARQLADELERQRQLELAQKQEQEQKIAREAEQEKLKREAEAKAQAQAQAQAALDAQARQLERERLRIQAEEQAKREAAVQAKKIADQLAQQEAQKQAQELANKLAQQAAIREAQELKAAEEAAILAAAVQAQAEQQARKLALEQKEAEDKAWQKFEAMAKREAEQLALEQALALALQEAEEKARQDAELALLAIQQIAEKEAQLAAQQQAIEAAQREAEEHAKAKAHAEEEAAALALRNALEQERKAAEQSQAERQAKKRAATQEQARRAAELQAKRQLEIQKKQQAEEKQKAKEIAKELAKEQAKMQVQAEAQAKEKAEELAKLATQKAERELAEQEKKQAQAQLEKQAQALAAQQTLQQERQAMQAEQLRLATEEKIRQEAEALAFELSQAQEQREWELQAKQAATDKLMREAERQAQKEADEQALKAAQIELEQQVQQERQARKVLEEAEQSAALEVQERLQLAQAQALDKAEALAAESARRKRERKQNRAAEKRESANRKDRELSNAIADKSNYQSSGSWVQLLMGAALLLSIALFAWAQLSDFSGRLTQFEKSSSAQLHQPVKIGQLDFSFLPQPHWQLQNVSIGEHAQIKIAQVNADIDISALLAQEMQIKGLEFISPVLNKESLGWLLFEKFQSSENKMRYFSASNLTVEWPQLALGNFELSGEFGQSGAWQNIKLISAQSTMQIELQPKAELVQVKMIAKSFAVPFGSELKLADFSAEGNLSAKALSLDKFYGVNYDGTLTGNANLSWGERWSLTGDIHAKQINLALAIPGLFDIAKLDGHAKFSMQGPEAAKLFASAKVNGNLQTHGGSLLGVNLLNLMQTGAVGGKSAFNDLVASFSYDGTKTYFRSVKLTAGLVSAYGSADMNKNEELNGRFTVLLSSPIREARSDLSLTGPLKKPRFVRATEAVTPLPGPLTDAPALME
ncbi:hypothetical protein [Undibacterium sp. Ren11W]|uniref:hypothetical protein n=1 Tax=Undibacterium sp. Ren11W TaxID=3413045 RepID=UPI003BF27501